jgi:hypothetical protein
MSKAGLIPLKTLELFNRTLTDSTLRPIPKTWHGRSPRTYLKDSKGHGHCLHRVVDIGARFAYMKAPSGGQSHRGEKPNGNEETEENQQGPEEGEEARSNETASSIFWLGEKVNGSQENEGNDQGPEEGEKTRSDQAAHYPGDEEIVGVISRSGWSGWYAWRSTGRARSSSRKVRL